MTDEDRRRILREARATLARPVEPYTPAPEPLHYRTYDPGASELVVPAPPRRLDTAPQPTPDWSGWESWVSSRIADALAAEREAMMER